MSLLVSLIPKESGSDISMLEKEIGDAHNDLFGFEKWRGMLWGHEAVKSLGCTLIPSLREQDVYVFDENVLRLKDEFLILQQHIDLVAEKTGIEASDILFRVQNALEAIRIAEKNLDKVGVALW